MQEAAFSETIKLVNAEGAERMVTFRGESVTDWEKVEIEISKYIAAKASNGWKLQIPRATAAANAAADGGAIPKCRVHGSDMKPSKKPGSFYCSRKLADGSYCAEKVG